MAGERGWRKAFTTEHTEGTEAGEARGLNVGPHYDPIALRATCRWTCGNTVTFVPSVCSVVNAFYERAGFGQTAHPC